MKISNIQMLQAEKLAFIAAFDVSDPALPPARVYDLIGRRIVENRLGECQIFASAHREAFWSLIADKAIPRAAERQVELILTNPRRTEDQKIAAMLHIISSYQARSTTAD
jgi:hypothetical protein